MCVFKLPNLNEQGDSLDEVLVEEGWDEELWRFFCACKMLATLSFQLFIVMNVKFRSSSSICVRYF